eukprot:3004566-Rhodomonas_salina.3
MLRWTSIKNTTRLSDDDVMMKSSARRHSMTRTRTRTRTVSLRERTPVSDCAVPNLTGSGLLRFGSCPSQAHSQLRDWPQASLRLNLREDLRDNLFINTLNFLSGRGDPTSAQLSHASVLVPAASTARSSTST